MITSIAEQHLQEIASVHRRSYHEDHFTYYFSEKMLEDFYREMAALNEFCYVSVSSGGNVNGFLVAGDKTSVAVKKFINKNLVRLSVLVITNPRFLIAKLAGFAKLFFRKPSFVSSANIRLLSIAVDTSEQRSGVGKELLGHFEQKLSENGISEYGLSVRNNNVNAIRFYEKNNFVTEHRSQDAVYFLKTISA